MAIFDIHHPWAFTFGILGNIVSIFVFLAPVPTFIRIHKEKSTMGFDSLPYSVALFSSMLWMYYAFIKTNALLLITINAFGCIIETIYLFIFLFYASKKARTHTAKVLGIMNVALMSFIFLFTFFTFHGGLRVQVVGWICVAVSISVFAAPLSILFQVVRTRSVEFMPFPLSFFLTLTAIMWFGYGLLQRDLCVALPNVIGFVLGLVQMLLYGIYRNSKPVEMEGKKSPENVINVVVVDAPELHSDKVEDIEDGSRKGEEEEGDIESRLPCAMSVEPSPAVSVQPVLVVCAA